MKIGIFSDIHDNLNSLKESSKALRECDQFICCGDLCSPFVVKTIGECFSKKVHIVFGNNDADKYRMMLVGNSFPHLKFYGEYVELKLANRIISINHFDNIGNAIAKAPGYDLVCFGHNHKKEIRVDDSDGKIILNPGEIYGGLSGVASAAIYDTERHEAYLISI